MSVPDGAVTDVGVIPQMSQSLPSASASVFYGVTYESASNEWVHVDRAYLSPDGKRAAYWNSTGVNDDSVHVLDMATGVDRVVYRGSTRFIVVAFESNGIYVVRGPAPPSRAFEKLYLLDPAGGTPPALVPGSDRHMSEYGWVLISDGAAWGIDYLDEGTTYTFFILRLGLATAQVTKWMEGATDDLIWPLGTDRMHRLYAGDNRQKLWRIGQPGQVEALPNPGRIYTNTGLGGSASFVSDSLGAWFAGTGGVWLYGNTGDPTLFAVGPLNTEVWPAGPCR